MIQPFTGNSKPFHPFNMFFAGIRIAIPINLVRIIKFNINKISPNFIGDYKRPAMTVTI
jgi:hypothetical protein